MVSCLSMLFKRLLMSAFAAPLLFPFVKTEPNLLQLYWTLLYLHTLTPYSRSALVYVKKCGFVEGLLGHILLGWDGIVQAAIKLRFYRFLG